MALALYRTVTAFGPYREGVVIQLEEREGRILVERGLAEAILADTGETGKAPRGRKKSQGRRSRDR